MKFEYNPNENKEDYLITKFGLQKFSKVYNAPYDAIDEFGNLFELKSTSKASVSTARDTSINHINKWRTVNWIIGFYDRETSSFGDIYFLSPTEMKDWLDKMEQEFLTMDNLCNKVLETCADFSSDERQKLERILKRGCTKNDPNIPNTYITKQGKKIDSRDDLYACLDKKDPLRKSGLLEFFDG